MISRRLAEADDRAVPGRWEGELVPGLGGSVIGALVEPATRLTMLLHLRAMEGHGGGPIIEHGQALASDGVEAVRDAISRTPVTYAEYVALDVEAVSKVPGDVPLDQAGAMPVAALTSLHGLEQELRIEPGQAVLVNGASGDVGHVAVQIAKLLGARVLAVASGDDGVTMARELGADVVVDGRKDDVAAAARDFAPEGLDAVLTFIAGSSLDDAISAVRDGGRVAYPLGVEPEPSPRDGVTLHHFDLTMDAPAVIKGKMARLNELVGTGPFEVRIAATVPLAEATRAHEALAHHRIGKIVLAAGG